MRWLRSFKRHVTLLRHDRAVWLRRAKDPAFWAKWARALAVRPRRARSWRPPSLAKFGELDRLHGERAVAARNELMRRTMTRRERREFFAKAAEFRAKLRDLARSEGFGRTLEGAKKYKKGRESWDEATAKAWAFFGDQIPAESIEAVELMPEPPGQGGRPVGTGLQAQDEELLKDVRPLVAAGEITAWEAAKKYAPLAAGGGALDSKQRRLHKRLVQGGAENNPSQD